MTDKPEDVRAVQLMHITRLDEMTNMVKTTLLKLDDQGRVWVYKHPQEAVDNSCGWRRMMGDDVHIEKGDEGWK